MFVELDEHPVGIAVAELVHKSQENFTLQEIYLYLLRLAQFTQFLLLQNAEHQLSRVPTLKTFIEALRSVTYGLPIAKTDNFFARHEFFEEEDIFQSFFNGGHNLDQYFSVHYFAFEIESEPIFVLQVKNISLDELLHLHFVGPSHLRHHELINFRHFAIL